MPDQPPRLLFRNKVPKAVILVDRSIGPLQRVQQVEVEIPRAGALKACKELLLRRGFVRVSHESVQFRGQRIALPGIPVRHRGLERRLAQPSVVNIGRVKIGSAGRQEKVCHLTNLRNVDAAVRILGKAHQPEAEPERVQGTNLFHCFVPPYGFVSV